MTLLEEPPIQQLALGPVTRGEARAFVNAHHRHNSAPPNPYAVFQVGLFAGEELVGVAIVGRPVARGLLDGYTLEIGRTCLAGRVPNGNSMLYGACVRAARALGYRRIYTYTLQSESGSSCRAVGFTLDAELDERAGWGESSVQRGRYETNLFGEDITPRGPKYRWRLDL